MSFDEYRSKVVAFLEPAQVDLYSERSAWDLLQEAVIARLDELR